MIQYTKISACCDWPQSGLSYSWEPHSGGLEGKRLCAVSASILLRKMSSKTIKTALHILHGTCRWVTDSHAVVLQSSWVFGDALQDDKPRPEGWGEFVAAASTASAAFPPARYPCIGTPPDSKHFAAFAIFFFPAKKNRTWKLNEIQGLDILLDPLKSYSYSTA